MKKRVTIAVSILLVVAIALGSFAFVLFRPKTLEQLIGIKKEDVTQVTVAYISAGKWVFNSQPEIDACWEAMNGSYRLVRFDVQEAVSEIIQYDRLYGSGMLIRYVTPEKTISIEVLSPQNMNKKEPDVELGYCGYHATDCNIDYFLALDPETAQPINS